VQGPYTLLRNQHVEQVDPGPVGSFGRDPQAADECGEERDHRQPVENNRSIVRLTRFQCAPAVSCAPVCGGAVTAPDASSSITAAESRAGILSRAIAAISRISPLPKNLSFVRRLGGRRLLLPGLVPALRVGESGHATGRAENGDGHYRQVSDHCFDSNWARS